MKISGTSWLMLIPDNIKQNRLQPILCYCWIVIILSCTRQNPYYGKAIITDYVPIYENEDNYIPHDHFMTSDMLDKPVEIKASKNNLSISNTYNSGFSGHQVKITLTPDLTLSDVKYEEWDDVEDGSNIKYTVEKIILSLNKNPFKDSLFTGYYSLQIRQDYKAGSILGKEGVNDTTYYSVCNGKFRLYTPEEKNKGKEWVLEQNELKYGIKDSLGIYSTVDKPAEFKPGETELQNILNRLKPDKSQVTNSTRPFVILSFIIDENGAVEPDQLKISGGIISKEAIQKIKMEKDLWTNWIPAEYKGRKVKSEINLPLQFQ